MLDFEHADWRDRLAADPPDFVKVLIRHRADGDPADDRHPARAAASSSATACAASPAGFLLELLTPYSEAERAETSAEQLEVDVRPRLVVEAITQIQDAGVDRRRVEGRGGRRPRRLRGDRRRGPPRRS